MQQCKIMEIKQKQKIQQNSIRQDNTQQGQHPEGQHTAGQHTAGTEYRRNSIMMKKETVLKNEVSVIPATKRHVQNGDQFRKQIGLRVAAYCRVSTEEESQQNSYAAQKSYYTTLILSRPGWKMVDIYADEGKSGTSRKNRVRFNQMMEDSRAGKIDYIITKSISRFARNTVDTLDCVHELQRLRPPVGVYFERENIDTLNANSEMFLTFYCSMAQEESHSISENIKWAIQKNFRSGKPQINLHKMLGYDKCRDGCWIINKEQAVTVRYIYERFLQGISANAIAKELNDKRRPTVTGGIWRADGVLTVLRNEKYVGDLRMQKTYTESFLTHKSVTNYGEYPQYLLEDHHPAIIDRDIWNQVQEILMRKQGRYRMKSKKVQTSEGEIEVGIKEKAENSRRYGPAASPFHGLVCGHCREKMRRMTYNSTIRKYKDERSHEGKELLPEEKGFRDVYTFSYAVWKCPNSAGKAGTDQTERTCSAVTLTELSMEQSFMEMLYRIKRDYQLNGEESEIMKGFGAAYKAICRKEVNSGFIEQKLKLIDLEIKELDANYQKVLQKLETVNYAAGISLGGSYGIMLESSGETYTKLADDLKKRLDEKKSEKERLMEERGVAKTMKQNFEAFLTAVNSLPDQNRAGMRLNINALDVDGSIFRTSSGQNRGYYKSQYNRGRLCITPELLRTAPDYLSFSHYIMGTFILKMEAKGDEICYGTTFGLSLSTIGNRRPVSSYLGYRISREDGNVEMILESYQISRGKIQHHWRKAKEASKGNAIEE